MSKPLPLIQVPMPAESSNDGLTGGNTSKKIKQAGEMTGNPILSAVGRVIDSAHKKGQEAMQANSNTIAGIASPVTFTGTANNPNLPTEIQAYQDYLKQNNTPQNVIDGIPQGLNNGNKEVASWINDYNSGIGKNNPINIPKTEQEINLAKSGQFNTYQPQTGEASQNVIPQKQNWISKLANGLGDFQMGYNENRNNGFTPENLTNNQFSQTIPQGEDVDPTIKTVDKSKMGRFGEFAGTVGRLAQNPWVQAGVSTVLGGMNGFGFADALINGLTYGSKRQMSNIYQKALQEQGVDINTGALGNLDNNSFTTLMTPKYKKLDREIQQAKLDQLIAYQNALLQGNDVDREMKKEQNEKMAKYREALLRLKKEYNEIQRIKATKTDSGGGKTDTPNPQDSPDWKKDLAGFSQFMGNPKLARNMLEARKRFIEKHGVDPMRYLK